jgi:IMP dehydrogenase
VDTTLDRLLFGPSSKTDGTENLVGAIRTCMGVCGAQTIGELHEAEMVVAPSIKTE